MSTYILTSMFPNGFDDKTTELFQKIIIKRNKFAFVASEFEKCMKRQIIILSFS